MAQHLAFFDERGRVRIPSDLADRVPWLRSRKAAIPSLLILEDHGHARLLCWDTYSHSVLARREKLIEDAESDSEALLALQVLEDRYQRLSIPLDLRPTLSNEILLHFGIIDPFDKPIYVSRVLDTIELLSEEYRNSRLIRSSELLKDLP